MYCVQNKFVDELCLMNAEFVFSNLKIKLYSNIKLMGFEMIWGSFLLGIK